MSVEDVAQRLSARVEGVGIATIYRAVAALTEQGWLETVEIANEPARYELAGKVHHHHFRCERCDRVFDLAGCVDNLRSLVPPKFRLRTHDVTLYGTCPACAREAGARATAKKGR